jgi:hypothetical protein
VVVTAREAHTEVVRIIQPIKELHIMEVRVMMRVDLSVLVAVPLLALHVMVQQVLRQQVWMCILRVVIIQVVKEEKDLEVLEELLARVRMQERLSMAVVAAVLILAEPVVVEMV